MGLPCNFGRCVDLVGNDNTSCRNRACNFSKLYSQSSAIGSSRQMEVSLFTDMRLEACKLSDSTKTTAKCNGGARPKPSTPVYWLHKLFPGPLCTSVCKTCFQSHIGIADFKVQSKLQAHFFNLVFFS